jgi:hypothetical protein
VPNPGVEGERDIKKERLRLQGILGKERQGVKASLEMLKWRCHHHRRKKMAVSITFSMGFRCSTRLVITFCFDREIFGAFLSSSHLTEWLSVDQMDPCDGHWQS